MLRLLLHHPQHRKRAGPFRPAVVALILLRWCWVGSASGLAGPGYPLVPPPLCPPTGVAREFSVSWSNLEPRPFCGCSRRADSVSGLRLPPHGTRSVRCLVLHWCCGGGHFTTRSLCHASELVRTAPGS
jgi:hypothetical protein